MADNKRPTHSVRAKTNRKDGEGNDVYLTCGAAWENDRGGMTVRISALPVPFEGLVYINPVKEE